jgi:hypothetical protein
VQARASAVEKSSFLLTFPLIEAEQRAARGRLSVNG